MKKLFVVGGLSLAIMLSGCGNEESDGAARVEEPSERVNEVTENVEDTEEKSGMDLARERSRERADEASRKAEEAAREYLESNDIDTDEELEEESEEGVDPFEHADTFPATVGNVYIEAVSYDATKEFNNDGEEYLQIEMFFETENNHNKDVVIPWVVSEMTLNTGEFTSSTRVLDGLEMEMERGSKSQGIVRYRFEDTKISELEWVDIKIPTVSNYDEITVEVGKTVRLRF